MAAATTTAHMARLAGPVRRGIIIAMI
jgi:hypothetical protein